MPPLCLEVLKDHLTRLFAPPPDVGRINSRGSSSLSPEETRTVLLHAEGIVGAARCAASLACCGGGVQFSELARCLCDRVVDPGYAATVTENDEAAARRDHEERAVASEALVAIAAGDRCKLPALRSACRGVDISPLSGPRKRLETALAAMGPELSERLARPPVRPMPSGVCRRVRPVLATLISGLVEAAKNDTPSTIALSDASFVHRIPRTVLCHLPSTTPFSSRVLLRSAPAYGTHGGAPEHKIVQIASCRLRTDTVLSIALSRAASAYARPVKGSEDPREGRVSSLVREMFRDDPSELSGDREASFIEADENLERLVDKYMDGQISLKRLRATMERSVIEMERWQRLNAALHAEGLLPSDAALYVEHGGAWGEMYNRNRDLSLKTVVTSAKFETAFRCPVLLRRTTCGPGIEWKLKTLWIAEVHAVATSPVHPDRQGALCAMRDRMTATVAAIDGDTVPEVGPGIGTLSDVLMLPRGSEQAEVFANIHAACCMDAAVTSVCPYSAITSFFALLDRVATAASEYRRTTPHAQTYERLRACPTRAAMHLEIARFSRQQHDSGQFAFSCPVCDPSGGTDHWKQFSTFALFSHIVDKHWKPFLPREFHEGG